MNPKQLKRKKQMISRLRNYIKDKRILILGFGREGRSTLNMLKKAGGYRDIEISDKNPIGESDAHNLKVICGEGYLDVLNNYDIVFKSPGVVLPMKACRYTCDITCQTEIFIQSYKDRVIGITGTKGKSTTSSLLYHELKAAGKDVLFAGNIGIPVFDIDDEINDSTIIVIELSCHQLEYAKTSPKIALLLNIYEDHLDHYGTREKYAAAKRNIFLNQNASDLLLTTKETVSPEETKSEMVYITKDGLPFTSWKDIDGVKLRGDHNLLNASFVYEICKRFEVSDEQFIEALSTFKPLAHRLEPIGNFDGIDYYDDSISTTVMSTINAVESIDNASVLLVGGMERNIVYDELVKYLLESDKLDTVICMYESGERIYGMLKAAFDGGAKSKIEVIKAKDIEESVRWVKANARKGGACILSPAAASYGYFKNFEERGDFFAKVVADFSK